MRATCGTEMSISGGSALPAGPVLVTTSSLPDGYPYGTRSTNVLSIFQCSAARQESRPAMRLPKGWRAQAARPAPLAAACRADRTRSRRTSFFFCRTSRGGRHPSPHLPDARQPDGPGWSGGGLAQGPEWPARTRPRDMSSQQSGYTMRTYFDTLERARFQTVQGQGLS
jgi:hypothetical protein